MLNGHRVPYQAICSGEARNIPVKWVANQEANIIRLVIPIALLIGIYLYMKKSGNNPSLNVKEKTLYIASAAHIKPLDPIQIDDVYTGRELAKVYEGLLEYHYLKRPIELVANLAAEMPHISADKLVYTFKIKQGVKFHDNPCFPNGQGRELTAHDFVYSIKRLADPKLQAKNFWTIDNKLRGINAWRDKYVDADQTNYDEEVEGVKALDDYTLQIALSHPDPQFLYMIAMSGCFAVPHEAVTHYGAEFGSNPVGTGPFVMEKFKAQDNKFVYYKNPTFRDKRFPTEAAEEFKHMLVYAGKKLPLVDKVVTHVLPEPQPKWLKFKQGVIDLVDISGDKITSTVINNNELVPELKNSGYLLYRAPQLGTGYFVFNNQHPLFKDNVKLKQAMSLAFDGKEFNELFYNNAAVIAQSTVPAGLVGYKADYVGPYVGCDLEKAKTILAEAGYPNGNGLPVITLDVAADIQQRQRGEFFQKCMAKIGIQVVVETHLFPELLRKMQSGQAMMHAMSWLADYPDAQNFFMSAYGPTQPAGVGSFFKDAAFDALYEKAVVMEDSPARTKLYESLKDIIAQKVPFICTVHPPHIVVQYDWLKNYCWNDFHYGTEQYWDIDLDQKKQISAQIKRWVILLIKRALGHDEYISSTRHSVLEKQKRSKSRQGRWWDLCDARLLYVVPILLGVCLLIFVMFNVVAGDPTAVLLGKHATVKQRAELRHELGLDKSLFLQYVDIVKATFKLDFGRSWASHQQILPIIRDGAMVSLTLVLPALAITNVLAIVLALVAAFFRGKALDRGLVVLTIVMMSVSGLVYILFGQWFFAYKLGWFEIAGYERGFPTCLPYITLPCLILVILSVGSDVRFYRTVILDEMYQDYVRTARAKGLPEWIILFKHILKNVLIPIITNVITQLPSWLLGTLLVESFFSIPGIGGITFELLTYYIRWQTLEYNSLNMNTDQALIPSSIWLTAFRKIFRSKLAMGALLIVLMYGMMALLSHWGVIASDWMQEVGSSYEVPNAKHWFGTDVFGRSVVKKVIKGTQVAMSVGFIVGLSAITVGVVLGAISGYFGGVVDEITVWICSTIASIPNVMLLISFAFIFGKGIFAVYIALGMANWVELCRLIRGEVIKHKNKEYVQAATALGASHFTKLWRHILPNVLHIVIIQFSGIFQVAIKSEVILSYLGLGVQNSPSWGVMISDAKVDLMQGVWWEMAFATMAMFVIVLAFNILITQFKTDQGLIYPVNDVSFEVYKGKTLGLVGESGSGKSVTALSIMRLINPPIGKIVGGNIFFEDKDLLSLSDKEMRAIRGNRIGMIFQEPMTSLNPVFTIGAQIREALTFHQKMSSKEAQLQTIELLRLVGIPAPEKRSHEYPHQLSGGMRQRVMIAMALSSKPDVLIADEPTTALDVTIQAQILELMAKLQDELNMGIILITHDLGIVAEVCHEVAVMYGGRIIEKASVNDLFAHPKHPYTRGLLASIPSLEAGKDHRQRRLETIKGTIPALHKLPMGCSFQARCNKVQLDCRGELGVPPLEEKAPKHWAACFHPSFPVRKGLLGKPVGEVHAVDNVSFRIKKGETLGLVGESGCGKSTLGKTLLRLIEPSAGEIILDGTDITKLNAREMRSIRQRIQLIFQDPYASLNPRMTVNAILTEPLKIHGLYTTTQEKNKRLYELLDYVQLPKEVLHKYPHEFSGGQRQRICIARALAVKPQFIVCDESVSALDVSIQAQVINLLMDLQKELGLTYLFIAHDLKVVEFISHQVAVMYLGRIVEQAAAEDIYRNPQHPYTKALLSAIPIPDPTAKKDRIVLKGDVPSPIAPPTGCHFHPRCWKATEACQKKYPETTTLQGDHWFKCYHPIQESAEA
eukprot:gene3018-3770_t